jgi:hypothetical protein
VSLVGYSNRITVDNTLDERLSILEQTMLPAIRTSLFGTNPNRKFYTVRCLPRLRDSAHDAYSDLASGASEGWLLIEIATRQAGILWNVAVPCGPDPPTTMAHYAFHSPQT